MKRKTIYLLLIQLCLIATLQPTFSIANEELQDKGTDQEQFADKITIYPNPTDGRFQISMDFGENDRIVAKVFDITGKLIKDLSNDLVKTDTKVRADVDLDHPRSGIYFLRVEIGKKIATRKIIVK
jgi:hypothetical protein